MSKKRSIAKKINLQLDFPLPECNGYSSKTTSNQDVFFGEKVNGHRPEYFHSFTESSRSSGSIDSFSEQDIPDIIWSKSSDSSTSGSEDLEVETTRKIVTEYESLQDVLYGEKSGRFSEENECGQWSENFPHLRIIGSSISIPPQEEYDVESYEEVIAEHSDDFFTEQNVDDSAEDLRNKIKEAVINNVLKEIQTKLLNKTDEDCPVFPTKNVPRIKIKEQKIGEPSSSHNAELQNESFLQISSMPLHNSPFRQPYFEYRSPVMKSHLSASKWQREDSSSDYSSLPYLVNSNVPCNNKTESKTNGSLSANKNYALISENSRKKSGNLAKPLIRYSPRIKNVTLPPIQNLNLEGEKAVSSTPGRFNTKPVSNRLAKLSDSKLQCNHVNM